MKGIEQMGGTRTEKQSLAAELKWMSVPVARCEASLPAFGLVTVGSTKEQALSRMATALSKLFDEMNR